MGNEKSLLFSPFREVLRCHWEKRKLLLAGARNAFLHVPTTPAGDRVPLGVDASKAGLEHLRTDGVRARQDGFPQGAIHKLAR